MNESPPSAPGSGEHSLDELPVGGLARIAAVDESAVSFLRLGALGFLPGRLLRLARAAPLGDPIAVDINGTRVGLRRCDARSVRVCREGVSHGSDS